MSASKPRGVSVSVWTDGVDPSNDCVTTECDHVDTQWRCPFALGHVSPMREGDQCGFKDGGDCRFLAAKLDALRRTLSVVKREIKKLEAEAED